jgi:hypothetical protein
MGKYQMKNFVIGILITLSFLLTGTVSIAQEGRRDMYYDLVELSKLIEISREAGFSEQQLRGLEIRDGSRTVNVMEYIHRIESKKLQKKEALKNFLSKQFLTVQDIYDEMLKLEPDTLIQLREELVSIR